ncbi:MAG: RNA polymerase sigma factor [Gammaproteobacteria bacterium]|nr:RNA polymerase sigma factor [Gammaproteobacteria bacterium]
MEERELVEHLKAGNEAVFNNFYHTHRRWILSKVYKAVKDFHFAEEITTDIFMKIWQKLHTFDFTKGSGLRSWINVLARYTIIDNLRARDRKGFHILEYIDDMETQHHIPEPLDYKSEPLQVQLNKEAKLQLEQALSRVPEKEREVWVLRCIEGWSIKEIAEKTGWAEGTVKIRIHRCKMKLQKILKRTYHE